MSISGKIKVMVYIKHFNLENFMKDMDMTMDNILIFFTFLEGEEWAVD